jgi:hypothetical protein
MVPKIIHNIWLQGYENLSTTIKIQHNDIKQKNPEWEFIVWDNNMIEKLLKKYPKVYKKYKNVSLYSSNINTTKSYIGRYIIMKEYGGLYCDIEYNCNNSFNTLFNDYKKDLDKNTIYVTSGEIKILDYINLFQKNKYSSCFMAMNKEHPIWENIINKMLLSTTQQQIKMAFDVSLQETEPSNKYPIVILNRVNGIYECINNNTICYIEDELQSNIFRKLLKFMNCNYKQVFLILLCVVTIVVVEYVYSLNSLKFGANNFIPGMPPSNVVQTQDQSQPSKTNTRNKKIKTNKK